MTTLSGDSDVKLCGKWQVVHASNATLVHGVLQALTTGLLLYTVQ